MFEHRDFLIAYFSMRCALPLVLKSREFYQKSYASVALRSIAEKTLTKLLSASALGGYPKPTSNLRLFSKFRCRDGSSRLALEVRVAIGLADFTP
jgi:hypothetical protein